jgi:hypothetical protein
MIGQKRDDCCQALLTINQHERTFIRSLPPCAVEIDFLPGGGTTQIIFDVCAWLLRRPNVGPLEIGVCVEWRRLALFPMIQLILKISPLDGDSWDLKHVFSDLNQFASCKNARKITYSPSKVREFHAFLSQIVSSAQSPRRCNQKPTLALSGKESAVVPSSIGLFMLLLAPALRR